MTTWKCPKCEKTKKHYGRGLCQRCYVKTHRAQYYKENQRRGRLRKKQKRVEAILAIKLLGKCTDCGETHPACLSFHHLDSSKKTGSVMVMAKSGVSMERLIEELKKCILLCVNCHLKRHWHK